MAAAMTMTALTGCAGSQAAETKNKSAGDFANEETAGETQTKEGEMPNLVVTYAYLEVPADIDAVSEKLNVVKGIVMGGVKG